VKDRPSVAPTMTVDRTVQDGIELSEYLRKHLGKDKIVIVGHSFGSRLGIGMAQARPDLFYAYVGMGQVADETLNYYAAYDALLKKAQTAGNQQAPDCRSASEASGRTSEATRRHFGEVARPLA